MEFVCELYADQIKAGRLFLHEHPAQASSWDEQCIERILKMSGVTTIDMDQCQFGQKDERTTDKETNTVDVSISMNTTINSWDVTICAAGMNQLYHANWDYEEDFNTSRVAVEFRWPMLRLAPYF